MNKLDKYTRIKNQLIKLFKATSHPQARMATVAALLFHKIDYFYWTGFYELIDEELTVSAYQGTLACLVLKKDFGVCWEAVHTEEPVLVADVSKFPSHIACDSKTKSEVVIPVFKDNKIVAVLDIDSVELNSFDLDDIIGLMKIVELIYKP
ncbi:MAG: histidine kinase [Candidatus Cloacimonetes bacterium 4572_65]|nr:MAG: histidine kinase [Candidatus Cloacimonetes bacterium 4572_65]